MRKGQQQKNVYDSVFDFIFSVQKGKKNKPFPKPSPSSGVYTSALIEIGTQPTIYPLESAFNTINSYIASQTKFQLTDEVEVDLGSLLSGQGNRAIKKTVAKNRARANFLRVGGNLHTGIDGALVSLYSRFNGASGKTAYIAGKLFADLERKGMGGKKSVFGYRTSREIEKEDGDFYQRGTDLMIAELVKKYPKLNKGMLLKSVASGQKQKNYNGRISELKGNLKLAGITRTKELNDLTRYVWGDGKEDLGLFLRQTGEHEYLDDKIDRVMSTVESRGEKERRQELYKEIRKDKTILADEAFEIAKEQARREFRDPEIEKEIKAHYKGILDPRERDKAVFISLNKKHQYDTETRGAILRELREETLHNTGQDIAKKAVMTSLVLSIEENARNQGDYAEVASARSRAEQILSHQSGPKSLGSRVARTHLLYNWVKDSGKLGDTLREGNWEDFGNQDLNFTNIMERVDVKDDDGNAVGSYYVPANSVMGKLLGSAYYLHPNNLVKGLFLDGGLLLKGATKGGKLNKKSLAYFAYKTRPGKILSGLTKPLNLLTKGVGKMLDPLVVGVKNFAKTLLKRIIGASGLAGWVVNKLMDVLGDKFQIIVAQVAQVVVMGAIALLFVLLESTGILYSEEKVEGILTTFETQETEAVIEEDIFTEEDFLVWGEDSAL